MKQNADYLNTTELNISVEAFDRLNGEHEFSERYQRNKQEMLKRYKAQVCQSMGGKYRKMAVAAAALLLVVSTSGIVNAATGGEFFHRIWGTWGKENIESHEEVLYDAEKGTATVVTYPKSEFEDVDVDKAQELIGASVSSEMLVKNIGDTKMTVLTSVYDGNAAVVEFTLEKEGGVDLFQYSQFDNETKGAWFTEQTPYYFYFVDCYEKIFVDLEKSTEDKLYCYDYMVTDIPDTARELTLEIYQTFDEGTEEEEQRVIDYLKVPLGTPVEKAELVNADGGLASISPMSMKVDAGAGLGLTPEEAYDPWHIYYVSVNYKDGTNYTVHEHEIEGVHSCGVETENTYYSVAMDQGSNIYVFNRLIDVKDVESITVNETVYTLRQ